MSDGYTGVALLGAPAAGSDQLGEFLESVGFFALDRSSTFVFNLGDLSIMGLAQMEVRDWAEATLEQFGGSVDAPPIGPVSLAAHPSIPELITAFHDARECAEGAPLVVSDARLVPLVDSWIRSSSTEFLPVLVLRNPLALARTLAQTSTLSIHEALAIWEFYSSIIFNAVNGHVVMAIEAEALATTPRAAVDFLEDLLPNLSVDAEARVAAPPQTNWSTLPVAPADPDDDFRQFATSQQLRMWEFAQCLSTKAGVVTIPPEFCAPSEAAVETMSLAITRRRQWEASSALAVKGALLNDELRAVYEKANQQEQTLIELYGERERLLRTEAQLRSDGIELLERVRAMSIAQGDAYRKMVTLSEELAVAHEILAVKLPWIDHLEREYAKMRRSETWRMGLIVGAPIRWTKSLARLGRKKDQE